jgi:hypothetical protein
MNEQTDARLAAAWQWLESMASLHGVMEIGIDVMGQDESETAQNVLCVNEVPEMDVWWEERPMLAGVQWTVAR